MPDTDNVSITVNGERKTFPSGGLPFTALKLMEVLGLDPLNVVAEINGDIVKRVDWPQRELADGDKVELVNFVGGG